MNFFFDNCISPKAAMMMDAFSADDSASALKDHFMPGTKDIDWLRDVGTWEPAPFIISGDGRIIRRAVEKKALRESGLTMFLFVDAWTHASWNEYAWRLVRVWPEIRQIALRNQQQSLYEVAFNKVKVTRLSNV